MAPECILQTGPWSTKRQLVQSISLYNIPCVKYFFVAPILMGRRMARPSYRGATWTRLILVHSSDHKLTPNSQNFINLSAPPETRPLPSGWTCKLQTDPSCAATSTVKSPEAQSTTYGDNNFKWEFILRGKMCNSSKQLMPIRRRTWPQSAFYKRGHGAQSAN